MKKGENVLVIYYENLIIKENATVTSYPEDFEQNLRAIIEFLDFQWDTERFKCLLDDNEGKFHRKKTCIDAGPLELSSSSLTLANGNYTMSIYQKKHIIWINSAISNVHLAMKERGFDSTHLSKYKSGLVNIVICP